MTPLILGALALLLAGPVPWAVAAFPQLRRTPTAALLWWQSMALAAVLSALGAGISLATTTTWRTHPGWGWVVGGLALAVTALVLSRLLLSAHRVGTEVRELRRRHLDRVHLVAERTEDGVDVLEHPVPVAFCVRSRGRSSIVLTRGAVDVLSPEQVAAVIAHERAHLVARHDLVLEAFAVLHRAFPAWVASRTAKEETALLIELMADRAAVRRTGPAPLAQALLAVAGGQLPAGSVGVADPVAPVGNLVVRAVTLGDQRRHPLQSVALVTMSGLLLGLPTALVVLPWLRSML